MNVSRRQPLGRLFLVAAPLLTLAAVGYYEPVALLLAAPWLVAVVWVVVKSGFGVVAGDDTGFFPSLGEEARRRLTIR